MPDFSSVKNTILSELMPNATNLTSLDTAVSNAIISSVKFYQSHKFTFNTNSSVNIVFVPDVEVYSVTSTFISMNRLYVDDADNRTRMYKRPVKWIQNRNVDVNYSGVPRFYGVFSKSEIAITPYSDVTATATAYFHSKLSDLMGGGSLENDWLNEGLDLIKTRSRIFIAENIIRDYGYATNLRIQEKEILDNLHLAYATQIKSDYIPNYFYDGRYGEDDYF